MRKIAVILTFVLVFSLTGCGSQGESSGTNAGKESSVSKNDSSQGTGAAKEQSSSDGKKLVLYYDYSENMGDTSGMDADAITSASLAGESPKGVEKNNLLVIVDEIREKTGADVFSVRQKETFDPNYDKMVMPAQDDQDENRQFTFVEDIDNLNDYDLIYIGMPVWWAKLPQPMKQFVETHDFSGKKIIPFGIHRGSQFGQMIDQLKELADGAEIIEDGYTVSATTANDEVREEVDAWLGK